MFKLLAAMGTGSHGGPRFADVHSWWERIQANTLQTIDYSAFTEDQRQQWERHRENTLQTVDSSAARTET